ncbi:bacterioferritin-associated ferredoxin [Angulomicrobium tetraedrale]|uniref:Bacterioferritin-associated ferredoxin n=1 Tax=Ancylobacter tetraedralis TaxID=217068 RepID=A0A839Z5X3_9HYPH|nr:(2Fe-2S)-binding protein [Ancylobacter tetraedralis]MBB3769706.1 bacterioferritin-associated ferredoxin [Ancylobacter tetraedralis]
MIVCSCNVLSDRQIRDALTDAESPARTAGQVYRCLGCSAQCGRCARTIRKLIDDVNAANCGGCARECPAHALVEGHSQRHNHPHNHTHTESFAVAAE